MCGGAAPEPETWALPLRPSGSQRICAAAFPANGTGRRHEQELGPGGMREMRAIAAGGSFLKRTLLLKTSLKIAVASSKITLASFQKNTRYMVQKIPLLPSKGKFMGAICCTLY